MTFFKRGWPVIFWAALLFAVSSIPGDELPFLQSPFGVDKLIHAGVYMVLGLFAVRAWPRKSLAPWIALVFCVGYGVTDELHQFLVPGRTPDIWDWTADAAGSVIGVFVLGSWLWRRKRRSAPDS